MNIIVFDTETVSLQKPFCYNIGYLVYNTDTAQTEKKVDYVVDQIWHNMELFSTAYYADKRPVYVSAMRGKRARLAKFGGILQALARDIEEYQVTDAYAYNSSFDERVFEFNCDWYKLANPLETLRIHDIRGFVHQQIAFTPSYQNFCDTHMCYTEAGNYSTTAETITQYLRNDVNFVEAHTALSDSEIELAILVECVNRGSEWISDPKVYASVPRHDLKEFQVVDADGNLHRFSYTQKRAFDDPFGTGIKLTIKRE